MTTLAPVAPGGSRVTYLLSLVTLGIVVYLGLLVTLWWFQERVVFQPPTVAPAPGVEARRLSYRAADGIELFAYLVGDPASAATVLLAFHGNADLAGWFVPWAGEVARRTGACVMIPEYRGYDGAPGRPTYDASTLDARAAFDCARTVLGVETSRVVFFGHSLGTAIAAELAVLHSPRALLLQSPFTSARAMAARMLVPGLTLFWSAISRVHFDTVGAVATLRCPVWVAHGSRDLIIPVKMGREVFDAAPVRGRLLIVDGAGHNDVPEIGGEAYWSWFGDAVASAAADPSSAGAGREAPK